MISGLAVSGLAGRQTDRECAALARLAFDPQLAAVAVDDMLDDGEAQPGAADRPRARRIDAVEPFGQARDVLAWDALALVLDRDADGGGAIVARRRQGGCAGDDAAPFRSARRI